MFRFTQESSSGSYNQRLAKITGSVQQCASVQTSVFWQQYAARTLTTSAPTRTVEQDL